MEEVGFLEESLQSQLGWFKGERGALSFHPDQEEKGKERQFCSSGPAEPSSVPVFLYNSAKPLADNHLCSTQECRRTPLRKKYCCWDS